MQTEYYLRYIAENIHSTVLATVDAQGYPATCAIDIMDWDEGGLYFLTARGKRLYDRLKANPHVAFTAMQGEDTLSRLAISVSGRAFELGDALLPRLFDKNPYMARIYPSAKSRSALTVFKIVEGTGEWFDLRRLPIERASFEFGGASAAHKGYTVGDKCTGCGLCYSKCPQGCIDISRRPAVINQANCLHCGNCLEVCPVRAIVRS